MKIDKNLSDETILKELGQRLQKYRLDLQWTQAKLAKQAGVSKRTIERMEAGHSTQLVSFIRVLRELDRTEGMEGLLPDTLPRPMDLLKLKKKERKRASSPRQKSSDQPWQWGDET